MCSLSPHLKAQGNPFQTRQIAQRERAKRRRKCHESYLTRRSRPSTQLLPGSLHLLLISLSHTGGRRGVAMWPCPAQRVAALLGLWCGVLTVAAVALAVVVFTGQHDDQAGAQGRNPGIADAIVGQHSEPSGGDPSSSPSPPPWLPSIKAPKHRKGEHSSPCPLQAQTQQKIYVPLIHLHLDRNLALSIVHNLGSLTLTNSSAVQIGETGFYHLYGQITFSVKANCSQCSVEVWKVARSKTQKSRSLSKAVTEIQAGLGAGRSLPFTTVELLQKGDRLELRIQPKEQHHLKLNDNLSFFGVLKVSDSS
ncbi:uncharacterized protein LOC136771934 [Amia ocellicauda]|uniref:uncharacterized protein LOC136771934 n=1 Tax=Amia ocellicauda TaxID=2972642 RepID=UPI003464385E